MEDRPFEGDRAIACSLWGEREMAAFDRAVIEHTMNAVIACDNHQNLVVFNPTAREWHGLDARQLPPEQWAEYYNLFLPDGETLFAADEVPLTRAFHGETVRNVSMVICAKGQPPRNVSCGGGPFFNEDGQRIGAFVVMVDTTAREIATKRLSESEALFARIVSEAPFPMVVYAEDGEIIQLNKVWEHDTGYSRDETPTMAAWLERALGAGENAEPGRASGIRDLDDGEHTIRTAGGDTRIWDFSSARLGKLPDGRLFSLSMARDVTELRQLAVELEHLATHDALTDLPNRRFFETEAKRAAAFADRGIVSSVLFADVDRFKTCNDRFGHEFGDMVLREVAQCLKGAVRTTDVVARIGGDEFGIVLWGQTGDAVEHVSERLSEAVKTIGLQHDLDIGLSIGAAALTSDTKVAEILAQADTRMYAAKASG